MSETGGHPWMGNSVASIKKEMLAEIGVRSIAELFEQIPKEHRLEAPLKLPLGIKSEAALRRHLTAILAKNESCEDNLNFLGAGCWQHHVPAVVDEIIGRNEFLTNVWGSPQSDVGRNQAWFEYASQLGELLNMDVVGLRSIPGAAPSVMPCAWRRA
jgi:glycine dehydrogenase subunit 1